MGTIRHTISGQEYVLACHSRVGRAEDCHLRIEDPLVSSSHAELRWTGTCWELIDLASRNGSYVNDNRLSVRKRRTLMCGSILAFGRRGDTYEMTNDDPPYAIAIAPDGTRFAESGGVLSLPSTEKPLCLVYRKGREWNVEQPGVPVYRVRSGATIDVNGEKWSLELPVSVEMTSKTAEREWLLEDLTLRFLVSRDQENVELELDNGKESLRLSSHVYWYTLLILARARQNDIDQAVCEAEAGWIYVEQLYIEFSGCMQPADLLNHHVYRAKKVFRKVGVVDFSNLIERRSVSKQIRFGACKGIDIKTS